MKDPDTKRSESKIENRLKEKRRLLGFSQEKLAKMAGITRQAVGAVESNQYSPATSVALRLAGVLQCRVEDLFSLKSEGEMIEGEILSPMPREEKTWVRAQVIQVGDRLMVRPLFGLGELANLATGADGLIVAAGPGAKRVKVRLFKSREAVSRQVVVGGCDPAMFFTAGYLRQAAKENLVPCLMGSSIALAALKRGELHVAGVHLADKRYDDSSLPYLGRNLKGWDCFIVTFAHWEEGLMVAPGNPKKICRVTDLGRRMIAIVNRENGSGARQLLDRHLKLEGIQPHKLKGYKNEVASHLEVASRIKAGLADVGIGVRAAAAIFGVDFIPLQRERYDLVIPRIHYDTLPGLRVMLDTIVSGSFRTELEAFGGYDTRETGKIVEDGPLPTHSLSTSVLAPLHASTRSIL
jgi:putative molybdopterin biosynthesis protein